MKERVKTKLNVHLCLEDAHTTTVKSQDSGLLVVSVSSYAAHRTREYMENSTYRVLALS